MLGDWGRPHNQDPNLNSQCEPPSAPPNAQNCPRGWGPLNGAGSLKPPPLHTPAGMPSGNLPIRTTDPAAAPARGWPRKGS